jgi:hypothetical protein
MNDTVCTYMSVRICHDPSLFSRAARSLTSVYDMFVFHLK